MFLFDYSGAKKNIDFDFDVEEIAIAEVTIISGDETLKVILKDGSSYYFDGADDRIFDFFDGSYILISDGVWRIDPNKWISRKNSYEGMSL